MLRVGLCVCSWISLDSFAAEPVEDVDSLVAEPALSQEDQEVPAEAEAAFFSVSPHQGQGERQTRCPGGARVGGRR